MRKWYPWVLAAAAFAFSAVVFNRLPPTMPTHWNAHGDVNGWSSRAVAAWLSPVLMIVMALVLHNLPKIDPRRANYEKFRGSYDLVVNAVITMLGILHVAMLGSALGWPISMARIAPVLVGGLFIVLGNVMPRARPNWWFGIRTPWTLSNDRVWERTHRVGGYLFVGAGVLLALTSILPSIAMLPIVIGCCVAVSVITVVYSYVAWKQETKG
jgi:uncharacterized membrane protein